MEEFRIYFNEKMSILQKGERSIEWLMVLVMKKKKRRKMKKKMEEKLRKAKRSQSQSVPNIDEVQTIKETSMKFLDGNDNER